MGEIASLLCWEQGLPPAVEHKIGGRKPSSRPQQTALQASRPGEQPRTRHVVAAQQHAVPPRRLQVCLRPRHRLQVADVELQPKERGWGEGAGSQWAACLQVLAIIRQHTNFCVQQRQLTDCQRLAVGMEGVPAESAWLAPHPPAGWPWATRALQPCGAWGRPA